MSYARLGPDSGVYVFAAVTGGIECCGCALADDGWPTFDTYSATLAHLEEHVAAGHAVPPSAIARLREEQAFDDDVAVVWRSRVSEVSEEATDAE